MLSPLPKTLRELPSLHDELVRGRLAWFPELAMGYYPVEAGTQPYDWAYFGRYAAQAATEMGRALMQARCRFVARHWQGDVVDIGIGSGAFVEAWDATGHGRAWGWDVNPAGDAWLGRHDKRWDIWHRPAAAVTLWDVLEHMPNPQDLLAQVDGHVFLSLPIFDGPDHVLRSRHFRRDEHYWYFTRGGLIAFMERCGFALYGESRAETELGREDIGTFAFARTAPARDAAA
jgi:hypothetical protein